MYHRGRHIAGAGIYVEWRPEGDLFILAHWASNQIHGCADWRMGEIVLRPVPMKQCLSGGTEAIVWLAFLLQGLVDCAVGCWILGGRWQLRLETRGLLIVVFLCAWGHLGNVTAYQGPFSIAGVLAHPQSQWLINQVPCHCAKCKY